MENLKKKINICTQFEFEIMLDAGRPLQVMGQRILDRRHV